MATPVVLPPLKQRLSPNQSSRHGTPITLAVLHDMEGSYAGSVSWLCNPEAEASAHICLKGDGSEATQLVPYAKKAWACEAFNAPSLNLEMEGFASKGYLSHELRVAARIIAFWCHTYGIPARLSDGSRPGIAVHQDLGAAGGGHHDPGFSRAKKLWFIGLVKAELKRGGFVKEWGV
jgi:N-acetyl-anhydromuramyl-L-alanine amidase AmpD